MPGVPPNALPKLKSFLKGMLKGGGKKKQQQQAPQQQEHNQQQPQQQQSTQQDTPQQHQTPPHQEHDSSAQRPSAPAQSQSDTLPPTQDHASTNQIYSQEALAADPEASSGAAPDPNVAGGPEGAQKVREEDREKVHASAQPAQPSGTTTQGTAPQEPAQAVLPAKHSETTTASTSPQPADTNSNTTTQPTESDTIPAPVSPTASTEKVDSVDEQAQSQAQPPPKVSPAQRKENLPVQQRASVSDEKMPVMAEPPTVAPVKAAPGMSATSGPLEDFP